MFWMGIWQDDNAIFFKLHHINESMGFFGKGLIGEGPYRFSFTPYWFIYKVFGTSSTFPYYLLIFIFYLLAAYAIYKFLSKFVSKRAGLVASILFTCGFVGSEGFFWIANGMVSNVSIILLCICLYYYFQFSLKNNYSFYFYSVIAYWATAYFTPIRSYYFIGIILLFEIIFLISKKTILRLIPFAGIFYYFFIYNGDSRTGQIRYLLESLLTQRFYIIYGFLTSLTNTIFSDSLTSKLFDLQLNLIKFTSLGLPYIFLGTIFLGIIGFYFLFRSRKHHIKIVFLLSTILIGWSIVSNSIFDTPIINLTPVTNYTVYLGGLILLYLLVITFVIPKSSRGKYLFITLSFILSIVAYWAYGPLVNLNTTHRYLTGAFSILVILLGYLYSTSNKKVKMLVIWWGVMNLISSFSFERQILNNRSFPVNSFYAQVKNYLHSINKGDVLYFDSGDSTSRQTYQNSISTASMPNETSFAWRYGIDRYDLKLVDSFADFSEYLKSNPRSNFHSFYFSNGKLEDTTNNLKSILEKKGRKEKIGFIQKNKDGNLDVSLTSPVSTLLPAQISLDISAKFPDISKITFPYISDHSMTSNSVAIDLEKRAEAFSYQLSKINIMKSAKVTVSSDWQTDTTFHLSDGNMQTNWRANRLLWGKENTFINVDLGSINNIGKFVWVNGFGNSTPTSYSLSISVDGKKWEKVSTIVATNRIEGKNLQIISFSPRDLRYIRMDFISTLDDDSPQIAEIWTFDSRYDNLDISDTEKFLVNPYGYVSDEQSFKSTIVSMGSIGMVSLNDLSYAPVKYDGAVNIVTFTLPAGGISISKFTLKNLQIPGDLVLRDASYKNLRL